MSILSFMFLLIAVEIGIIELKIGINRPKRNACKVAGPVGIGAILIPDALVNKRLYMYARVGIERTYPQTILGITNSTLYIKII